MDFTLKGDELKTQGARKMKPKVTQTVDEAIGREPFYPNADRRELAMILDMPFILKDARIVEAFETAFGVSDFALLLLEDSEGAQFTTLCGGMVVVKKIRLVLEGNLFPLMAVLSKGERYYDIN